MTAESGGGIVRMRIIYTGRVQGVCFRAISQELAQRRRVVGWVRNVPDGTVELETEGTPDEVEAFLASIAQQFSRNITHADRTSLPARLDESRFSVRY